MVEETQPVKKHAPLIRSYQLTAEEKSDLTNRAAIKETLLYQAHCVDMEMKAYVERFVKTRLNLEAGDTPEISLKEGMLRITKPNPLDVPIPPSAAVVTPAVEVNNGEQTGTDQKK